MPRQYNLSLTQTYKLIDSYYGSLEENGTCCQNCGALIANVAIVEGQTDKQKYYIGMDCAETLTGIKDDFSFEYVHKVNFNIAKQIRTKLMKSIKLAKEKNLAIDIKVIENKKNNWKGWNINSDKPHLLTWWKMVETEVFEKYVYPMTKDLVKISGRLKHD